jgi:cellulose 1,4-beta-cellobiosidase
MFNFIGKEFTFDVDVSKLPCGLNGALYSVEMAADGGMGKGNNKAGAKYGTGECAPVRFYVNILLIMHRLL